MKTIRFGPIVGTALALFTLSCGQQPLPDTRAADEAAIREADMAWAKVAGAKDLEATLSYYADDAALLPPNEPIATGKEGVRKVWTALMGLPGFAVSWAPVTVEVARSGDLAYTRGTYELSMNNPKGEPMKDRGKYIEVWRKQADGKWKVAVDMFNSDLPPAK
jgi:ketosteroid isomerase-like protein